MRRLGFGLLLVLLLVGLCACGQSAEEKWQEQYDLGLRYLGEGNYEEAIVAFTAAIEIDPKRPEAFTGRGDAYFAQGDEQALQNAAGDYEAALALDGQLIDLYGKLAEVCIALGDAQSALDVLTRGYELTGDGTLAERMEELTDPFLSQDDFVAYREFPQAAVDRLEAFTAAAESQDLGAVLDFCLANERGMAEVVAQTSPIYRYLVEREGEERIANFGDCHTYSVMGDYKVNLWSYTGNDGLHHWGLELHPREGTGYYLYFTRQSEGYTLTYLVGSCADWNWDGAYWSYTFEDVRWFTYGGGGEPYYEVELYDGIYTTGTASGGMIDGVKTTRRVGGLEMGEDDPMAEAPAVTQRVRITEGGGKATANFGTTVEEERYEQGRKLDTEYFQEYRCQPTGWMVEADKVQEALW